jgi:hypothetical protein
MDEAQSGGLIDRHHIIFKFIIAGAIIFGILWIINVPVDMAYLGYYPDENITSGSPEWKTWHEVQLNKSVCANKEILNTWDCCGGHVDVYCKKFLFPVYIWSEIHAMENVWRIQWCWEK